jgi:hypothetical protein
MRIVSTNGSEDGMRKSESMEGRIREFSSSTAKGAEKGIRLWTWDGIGRRF